MRNVGKTPVILSVDDDENAHILLKRAFSKGEVAATLVEVRDGSEAIRYLAGEGEFADRSKYPLPDLVLLDLKMPRVSGFDVLEFENFRRRVRLQKFYDGETNPLLYAIKRASFKQKQLEELIRAGLTVDSKTVKAKVVRYQRQLKQLQALPERFEKVIEATHAP